MRFGVISRGVGLYGHLRRPFGNRGGNRRCETITKSGNPIARGALKIALLSAIALADHHGAWARTPASVPSFPAPNFAHFDHLLVPAEVGSEAVGVLNIYSKAPDFRPVIAADEGYACVDDAARGIVLLSAALDAHDDQQKRHQLQLLTKFVLTMQNSNGYFNNFVQPSGQINTDYKTSVAGLNWWSLRALWGLEEANRHLAPDSPLAKRIAKSTNRLLVNLGRDVPAEGRSYGQLGGRRLPNWLPSGSGADQAAVAILGLLPHYQRTHDGRALALILAMADGIKAMQVGGASNFPYGVHLSWQNNWHAWGSDQAYALLLAGRQLHRPDYVASGLAEVDHFYPYLLRHGYLAEFGMEKAGARFVAARTTDYPQIAYGIRPMVFAADEAWRITGKQRYRVIAKRFASWLVGNNIAHRSLYDPASGRVSDGIETGGRVNPNSGAESTLEGLMVLQRFHDDVTR